MSHLQESESPEARLDVLSRSWQVFPEVEEEPLGRDDPEEIRTKLQELRPTGQVRFKDS